MSLQSVQPCATSLVGAGALSGRLVSGYLLDRVFAPRVAILFYGATALGMAILCAGRIGNVALAASFLVGLGMGAEVETMGYMISRYFGLLAFGTAYGHAFAAFMICRIGGRAANGRRIRSLSFLYGPARRLLREQWCLP